MARYGIKAQIENVLITSGSQQALDLIGKLFINRGDRVLVEAPPTWARCRRSTSMARSISRSQRR